jgi:hypothetical protein
VQSRALWLFALSLLVASVIADVAVARSIQIARSVDLKRAHNPLYRRVAPFTPPTDNRDVTTAIAPLIGFPPNGR